MPNRPASFKFRVDGRGRQQLITDLRRTVAVVHIEDPSGELSYTFDVEWLGDEYRAIRIGAWTK
jgi:hypothetical protein